MYIHTVTCSDERIILAQVINSMHTISTSSRRCMHMKGKIKRSLHIIIKMECKKVLCEKVIFQGLDC